MCQLVLVCPGKTDAGCIVVSRQYYWDCHSLTLGLKLWFPAMLLPWIRLDTWGDISQTRGPAHNPPGNETTCHRNYFDMVNHRAVSVNGFDWYGIDIIESTGISMSRGDCSGDAQKYCDSTDHRSWVSHVVSSLNCSIGTVSPWHTNWGIGWWRYCCPGFVLTTGLTYCRPEDPAWNFPGNETSCRCNYFDTVTILGNRIPMDPARE